VQLVFIANNEPVTDSLTIAQVFNKSHDHVMRDIRNQLEKLHEAGEGSWGITNFGETHYIHLQNGQRYAKFNLTEDAFAIVAMSYVTPEAMKMKVKFLEEFKRMRLQLSQPTELERFLLNPDTIIKIAENWKAEQTLRIAAEAKIEADRPKVLFAEALEVSSSSILIGELAKLLKQNGVEIGQNRLFQQLRQDGYLMRTKDDRWNDPTQRAMEMGLFEVKMRTINNPDGSVRTTKTTKVTGKGCIYFVNKFKGAETA
jgi:Rha family phage regulatory protein